MGFFDFIGDALGGITDLALGVVSPVTNAFGFDLKSGLNSFGKEISGQNAREMNQENIAMQRETNQQNYLIHQQDMANQMQMQQMAQNFNAAEAEKARQFNGAPAQMQRLQQAGINPFAAAQAVSGVQANSSGVSASVSPSSVPVGAPMVAPRNDIGAGQQGFANAISMFQTAAKLLESLGSHDKNTAEADRIRALLAGDIEYLHNLNTAQQIDNASKKISFNILQLTGLTKANQEIKNMIASEAKDIAEANLFGLQGDTEKSKKLLTDAQAKHEKIKARMTRKQVKYYDNYITALTNEANNNAMLAKEKATTEGATRPYVVQNIKADTGEKVQSAAMKRAQARIYGVSADLEEMRRDFLTNRDTNEYGFPTISVLEQLFNTDFRQKVSELARTDKEVARLDEEIKKLFAESKNIEAHTTYQEKENDWYAVKQVFDMADRTASHAENLLQFWKPRLSSSSNTSTFSGRTETYNESYVDHVSYKKEPENVQNHYDHKRSTPRHSHFR